jgi:hypothetical protein
MERPLLELVDRINAILGTDIKPIHTTPRVGDIRHSFTDITRAQADLGYCCACVPVSTIMRPKGGHPKHLRQEAYHFN